MIDLPGSMGCVIAFPYLEVSLLGVSEDLLDVVAATVQKVHKDNFLVGEESWRLPEA